MDVRYLLLSPICYSLYRTIHVRWLGTFIAFSHHPNKSNRGISSFLLLRLVVLYTVFLISSSLPKRPPAHNNIAMMMLVGLVQRNINSARGLSLIKTTKSQTLRVDMVDGASEKIFDSRLTIFPFLVILELHLKERFWMNFKCYPWWRNIHVILWMKFKLYHLLLVLLLCCRHISQKINRKTFKCGTGSSSQSSKSWKFRLFQLFLLFLEF